MRTLFFLLLCFGYQGLFGQNITVISKDGSQPIAQVVVLNQSGTILQQSDSSGSVNLSAFSDDDILTFSHPSYNEYIVQKSDLLRSNITFIALEASPIEIEEVVISASKWEENRMNIPLQIKRIKPEAIQFQNSQTSADMLAESGQVFLQKSQLGGGSPMIRGFAANALLIIVDGVRINNAIYRNGNLQNVINIDPSTLASAEVIFGPGSVTYGSDALGGVMNFTTLDPKFSTDGTLKVAGNGLIRYASANNERTWNLRTGIGGQNIAWAGTFTFSKFDDLISGSNRPEDHPEFGKRNSYVARISGRDSIVSNPNPNRQLFSGYSLLNTMQKISFKASDKLNLQYTFNFSTTTDIPRYDRLTETDSLGSPVAAEWRYGPQRWMMNALEVNSVSEKGMFDAFKLIISQQQYLESRHNRRYRSDLLENRREKVNIAGINADFDKTLAPGHRIFYGLEGYYNAVTSTAEGENIETSAIVPIATRYPDNGSSYFGSGIYMNYRWSVSPQIYFNGGARLNYTGLDASNSGSLVGEEEMISLDNVGLSGSIGGVIQPTPVWKLSGTISTGFRAPNIDDIGKIFEVSSGVLTVPNPDLLPETTNNFELGIEKVFSDGFGFEVVGFFTNLKNAMVRRNFPINGNDSLIYEGERVKTVALVNTGKGTLYGAYAGLSISLVDNLVLSGNLTYTYGRDVIDNVPLRHAAPIFGNVSLKWNASRFGIELYSMFQGSIAFEDLAPSEQDKPYLYSSDGALGWTTLNLRSSINLNSYLTLNAGVENIMDSYYRTYSSGIGAPGRNFIVSIRGKIPN